MKKVIITGVTGQAGSFFVDYLLKNTNYQIYGLVRRLSVSNHKNIEHNKNNPRFHLLSADLTDEHSLRQAIETVLPDYFINCAAQSFVAESWISPVNTFQTDCIAVIHILETIRKSCPHCRFVNFGSSEQFGDVVYSPQDINHPFRARSPYAAAKIAAHQIVKVYKESYNLYALQPICHNYEGIRRGQEFVTRKITQGVARIYHSIQLNNYNFEPIAVGNLGVKRDWSDAEDFVDGIWRILNQEDYNDDLRYDLGLEVVNKWKYLINNIKNYLLASGEVHSVREFIELAFKEAQIEGVWFNFTGKPEDEEYILAKNGLATKKKIVLVRVDFKFYRPADVELLQGDSNPIRKELGWEPKTTFTELVKKMVAHDIQELA